MLLPRTSIKVFFSGFLIISFNNFLNVIWDDDRAFNQKFEALLIPDGFHFWDLVSAALSSFTVIFSYSCFFNYLFPLHIPYPARRHITSSFLSPYPFPELFYISLVGVSFTITLFFFYFSRKFFAIRLEYFILFVKFVTFIKSSFPLCFYLCFRL